VLPVLFVKDIRRWWLSVLTAIAAGLMLGASWGLINTVGTSVTLAFAALLAFQWFVLRS
jgi:hypothetical protein